MNFEIPVITSTAYRDKADVNTVKKIRAVQFLELIKSGVTPKEAASTCGRSLDMLTQDPEVKAAAKLLQDKYTFSAEERKRIVRAKTNQIILEGSDKDSINAIKVASTDPELGLTVQTPMINQIINGSFTPEMNSFLDSQEIPAEYKVLIDKGTEPET